MRSSPTACWQTVVFVFVREHLIMHSSSSKAVVVLLMMLVAVVDVRDVDDSKRVNTNVRSSMAKKREAAGHQAAPGRWNLVARGPSS